MSRPKSSVLLVRTPACWRPSSHHSTPTEIVSATFLARRLPLHKASAVTAAFNRAAYREFAGTWALCVVADRIGRVVAKGVWS